jgi:hypothetical protein
MAPACVRFLEAGVTVKVLAGMAPQHYLLATLSPFGPSHARRSRTPKPGAHRGPFSIRECAAAQTFEWGACIGLKLLRAPVASNIARAHKHLEVRVTAKELVVGGPWLSAESAQVLTLSMRF